MDDVDELEMVPAWVDLFLDFLDLLFMRVRLVPTRWIPILLFQLQLSSFPGDECQLAYKTFGAIDPPLGDRPAQWALLAYMNPASDGSSNLISYLLPVESEPGRLPSLVLSPYTLTPLRSGSYETGGGPLAGKKEDLRRFLAYLALLRLRSPRSSRLDDLPTGPNHDELAEYLGSVTLSTVVEHLKKLC
jgi:hypothetical protein